jgi:hypothetical protein
MAASRRSTLVVSVWLMARFEWVSGRCPCQRQNLRGGNAGGRFDRLA